MANDFGSPVKCLVKKTKTMNEKYRNLCGWQIHCAFWGTILWCVSLQALDFILQNGWMSFYSLVSGYIIGSLTALAGLIFWGIIQGRAKKFLGEQLILRLVSAIPVFAILIYGFVGFIKGIFCANPWTYSLAFFIGGTVVQQGLMPLLECIHCDFH